MCQMCEEYEAELRRLGIAMDEITVKLDERQLEALGKRASRHGHGIAEEVQEIIRTSIELEPPMEPDRRIERLRRFRNALPPETTDSLTLLREDRDR